MTTPDKEEMPTEDRTAGPWTIEGPDQFGDYNIHHPADRLAIGAVVSNLRPPEENAANAHFIVTACNAYEPMREALQQARRMCWTAVRLGIDDPAFDPDKHAIIQKIDTALSTLPVNDRHHSGSDSYQADASAPALSEKVTLPSEQEALLLRDFESYRSRGTEFVGAYRAGLSSAMGICDLLADECGSRTKATRRAFEALKVAADRIEHFRRMCSAELNFSNDAERDGVSLKSDTSSQPSSEAGKLSTDEVL
ncbi:hypothetical protein Hden_1541 [Hyphomicrobium denitrificans ATCC 51888]|uniref:Uncharacterized protein n=1 Tax=Hyphomicrobium denitrificans (strain ATCC 51888 / DSM 1869 / NCIMB 11706 / TK 0415) TaxID=582899 RepID=D8JQ27_HYPDA|nr:hypothetical protein [Hyphomicrobium denitrificans]ADJ21948.1 hypothetical protein Hden_0121 [Hyphomicrobium denitrificans ATCC 51888]ADJ23353.1 hypothetical protein Hden_1541 [Hyphomicrobium denitrificans ATCC 51888]